jgi:hypothetical protein
MSVLKQMLTFFYARCSITASAVLLYYYAECHYTECRGTELKCREKWYKRLMP